MDPFGKSLISLVQTTKKDDEMDEVDLYCSSLTKKLRKINEKDPLLFAEVQIKIQNTILDGLRQIAE